MKELLDRNVCWYCGEPALRWESDFMYSEVYGEGDGVVHFLTCDACKASVEYITEHNEDE